MKTHRRARCPPDRPSVFADVFRGGPKPHSRDVPVGYTRKKQSNKQVSKQISKEISSQITLEGTPSVSGSSVPHVPDPSIHTCFSVHPTVTTLHRRCPSIPSPVFLLGSRVPSGRPVHPSTVGSFLGSHTPLPDGRGLPLFGTKWSKFSTMSTFVVERYRL